MASPDRLSVLFVFTPVGMGADTWVHLLAMRHLAAEGVQLYAAVEPDGPDGRPSPVFQAVSSIPGVTVLPTRFGQSLYREPLMARLAALPKFARALGDVAGLAHFIRRNRIDVLHASDRPRDALVAALLASITGAKFIIHVHVKFAPWVTRKVRWAMSRADGLIGVSEFVAKSLVEGGFSRSKVHAVANAIDLPAWDPATPRERGRASLGVSPSAPLVLCVARIFPAKGQQLIVRALPKVVAEFPALRLAIVGADYPPGTKHSEELRQLAEQLGVAQHVLFPGHRNDVADLMAAADVFCMPSPEEPFGLVFAEAMAMGVPVVALGDGGTVEVVVHGEHGLLSQWQDVDALAANLRTLLADPELRKKLGRQGRERVVERFTAPRLAADLRRVYEQTLSGA